MYKACSRCGKIHKIGYKCNHNRPKYQYDYEEAKLRNTDKWHKKAQEIKERSKYLCAECLRHNIYNYKDLETHHIDKLKDRPDRLLDDSNLICLCRYHHRMADAGMIAKEILFKMAEERDNPPMVR